MNEIHDFFVRISILNILFHLACVAIFDIAGIQILFYYNIASFAYHILIVLLSSKRMISEFTRIRLFILEFLISYIISVLCIGFTTGFTLILQVLLIGFFFLNGHSIKLRYAVRNDLLLFLLFIIVPIFVVILILFIKPVYQISDLTQTSIFLLNFTFSNIFIFHIFTIYRKNILAKDAELKIFAEKDPLTNLFNRRKIRDIFSVIKSKSEGEEIFFCVSILDIDDFKKFNDKFGHETGDYILSEFSSILLKHAHIYEDAEEIYEISNADLIVGRWGGEEFLIIQTFKKDDYNKALEKISSIINEVCNHDFYYKGEHLHVTSTAGTANSLENKRIDEVINCADMFLYKGKRNGKNIHVFN